MKKSDNLAAWRAFLEVVHTGSVSVAAAHLDLDPPTISRYIKDLEEELDDKLFDRSFRPFRLTKAGHLAADTVVPLVSGFDSLSDLLGSSSRRVLNVAAPTDLNQCYLHDQLAAYMERNPRVSFYLRSSCMLDDILSGRVDIALIDRPQPHPNLVIRFVVQARAVPLAARSYVERYGSPRTPEDLKEHTGLLLRQGHHQMTSFLYDRSGAISPVLRWKKIFMTDAQLTLNHMMLDGLGIIVDCVPQHLADELANGQIVRVLPGWERRPQELCIVTRRDREGIDEELHDFALWWRENERKAAAIRVKPAEALLDKIPVCDA